MCGIVSNQSEMVQLFTRKFCVHEVVGWRLAPPLLIGRRCISPPPKREISKVCPDFRYMTSDGYFQNFHQDAWLGFRLHLRFDDAMNFKIS
jgi:hypothetical protein